MASPAPLKFSSFISEYFLDRMTPSAPARKAASTASRVPCRVDLLDVALVGISISIPGQSCVLVPFRACFARRASRYT